MLMFNNRIQEKLKNTYKYFYYYYSSDFYVKILFVFRIYFSNFDSSLFLSFMHTSKLFFYSPIYDELMNLFGSNRCNNEPSIIDEVHGKVTVKWSCCAFEHCYPFNYLSAAIRLSFSFRTFFFV